MLSKSKLKIIKRDVNTEDRAHTNKELKDLVLKLVESHVDALNKLQTAEGKVDNISFNNDPFLYDV